jgi:Conserved oligomeric complex COG6
VCAAFSAWFIHLNRASTKLSDCSSLAGLTGDETNDAFFDGLLATVLAPVIEACERSASSLPPGELSAQEGADDADRGAVSSAAEASGGARMPPNADRVYLINCLLAVWSPLSLHRPCASRAAALRRRVDEEVRIEPGSRVQVLPKPVLFWADPQLCTWRDTCSSG